MGLREIASARWWIVALIKSSGTKIKSKPDINSTKAKILLVGFILYQIFEFFNHGSISMLVLCAVDVLMIILTLLEYRKLKAHISKEGSYSSLKNSKVN